MYGYLCIGFIDLMLKGKSLLDHIKLFSPNDYEKNDNIFNNKKMKKLCCFICVKYRKFEKPKISRLLEKRSVLSI